MVREEQFRANRKTGVSGFNFGPQPSNGFGIAQTLFSAGNNALIRGGTMIVCDVVVMMVGYTALASTILPFLKDPNHIRWTNHGVGSLFVAACGALAVVERG